MWGGKPTRLRIAPRSGSVAGAGCRIGTFRRGLGGRGGRSFVRGRYLGRNLRHLITTLEEFTAASEHAPLRDDEMEKIHQMYEQNFDITPYVEESVTA